MSNEPSGSTCNCLTTVWLIRPKLLRLAHIAASLCCWAFLSVLRRSVLRRFASAFLPIVSLRRIWSSLLHPLDRGHFAERHTFIMHSVQVISRGRSANFRCQLPLPAQIGLRPRRIPLFFASTRLASSIACTGSSRSGLPRLYIVIPPACWLSLLHLLDRGHL